MKFKMSLWFFVLAFLCAPWPVTAGETESAKVTIDWNKPAAVSTTNAAILYIPGPPDRRGTKMHDDVFGALRNLHADFDTYLGWWSYPRLVVAEIQPPTGGRTSWDFSYMDPYVEDFMEATKGHPVALDFSTVPQWMFKTDKPVAVPSDPAQQVFYIQGNKLRDPTGKELADYYARLAGWYMRGGFTDENGVWHKSDHHFAVNYWGVLNEVDFEHATTPEQYTRRYDAIVGAVRKVTPELKFAGPYLAWSQKGARFFQYFLNPKNHRPGIPIDMLTYHFFALPAPDDDFTTMITDVFAQADTFLSDVQYIEQIRQHYWPQAETNIDELGIVLPDDFHGFEPGWKPKPIPDAYWNLYGAYWAYQFAELCRIGIQVVGVPQLFGFPPRTPSSTAIDWRTGKPNSAYWVLKMIRENLGPGGEIFDANVQMRPEPAVPPNGYVYGMGYKTVKGKRKILLISRRNRPFAVEIADLTGSKLEVVDQTTAFGPPRVSMLSSDRLTLGGLAVAIITLKQ